MADNRTYSSLLRRRRRSFACYFARLASSHRIAACNNSTNEVTPNLSFARAQYAWTVFKLKFKSPAICDGVRPSPSKRKISNSRSLKRSSGEIFDVRREELGLRAILFEIFS